MNKLTKKEDEKYIIDIPQEAKGHFLDKWSDHCVVNKLGQLEDIEEELGIDLITLFNALFNGAYFKDKLGHIFYAKASLLPEYDNQSEIDFWLREEEKQENIKITGFVLIEQVYGDIYIN